jgi:hypothetical protein
MMYWVTLMVMIIRIFVTLWYLVGMVFGLVALRLLVSNHLPVRPELVEG